MNIIRGLIIIMALGAAAGAQQPKNAPAPQAKPVDSVSPDKLQAKQPPAARDEKKQAPPVRKKTAEAGEDEGEGSVMVDTKAEDDITDPSYEGGRDSGEANAAAGIPSSYGQLKGTLSESGRSLLVFENEDGVISFVQVVTGKATASWKLVSRLARNPD
jgi:hypothetical protein